jgi:hypothetical protein
MIAAPGTSASPKAAQIKPIVVLSARITRSANQPTHGRRQRIIGSRGPPTAGWMSGGGEVGANRPGRAPGLLAGDKVNSRLALVDDGVVDPDTHDAACAHV